MREPLGAKGLAGVLLSVAGMVLLTRPPFLGFPSGPPTTTSAFCSPPASAAVNSTTGADVPMGSSGSGSSSSSSLDLMHGDMGTGPAAAAGCDAAAAAGAYGWGQQRILGTLFAVASALFAAGAFISIRYIGKSGGAPRHPCRNAAGTRA